MPDPHDEDKIEAEDLRRLIEQSANEELRCGLGGCPTSRCRR
jgi:hypothetical protein